MSNLHRPGVPGNPQLYAIFPGGKVLCEEMRSPNPLVTQTLVPLFVDGEGTLPDDPEVTVKMDLSSNMAHILFYLHGSVILAAAVSWGFGEHANQMWDWICADAGGGERAPAPTTEAWAAIALPPPPLPAASERIFGGCGWFALMAPSLIDWVNQQN